MNRHAVMLSWQEPTTWSRETVDGVYYIELHHSGLYWRCYRRGLRFARAETESDAKAMCRLHASLI